MEGWKKNGPKEHTRAREARELKPVHWGSIPVAGGPSSSFLAKYYFSFYNPPPPPLFFLGQGRQTKILNRGGLTYI